MRGHPLTAPLSRPVARLAAPSLLALLLVPATLVAQEHGREHAHAQEAPDLGAVDFAVSCDPGVRADFDESLALMHHMMYEQARAGFEAVAGRDPDCGMAYWGVAMTHFHPLWHPMDQAALDAGRAALERARAAGVGSAREEALLAATEALMADDGMGWWGRLDAWAGAMQRARAEHPDDEDVAALYALSQLAAGQAADDRMAYNERAAEVLLAVHERVPTHPGASHYTIHANDVTGRAGESLDIVRGYDDIAPSVPHALHMPTHIYVRLGDWPEVIDWNRRSADAALDYPAGDRVSLHWIHALDYLVYAYLQQANDAAARAVLEDMRDGGRLQENFASAFHLATIPARYAVERRDWKAAAAIEPRSPAYIEWDRSPWPEALSWFARGLGAAHTDEVEAAVRAESRMAELRDRAEAEGQQDHARYIEIDRLVLAGAIAQARGRTDEAIGHMRGAVELETTIEKHPVSPGALLPPAEALGDLLLEVDRPAEALAAYERSLDTWPARYHSLLGAARAARAAGDAGTAAAHYRTLLDVVDRAAAEREGVEEALRNVGR